MFVLPNSMWIQDTYDQEYFFFHKWYFSVFFFQPLFGCQPCLTSSQPGIASCKSPFLPVLCDVRHDFSWRLYRGSLEIPQGNNSLVFAAPSHFSMFSLFNTTFTRQGLENGGTKAIVLESGEEISRFLGNLGETSFKVNSWIVYKLHSSMSYVHVTSSYISWLYI